MATRERRSEKEIEFGDWASEAGYSGLIDLDDRAAWFELSGKTGGLGRIDRSPQLTEMVGEERRPLQSSERRGVQSTP